LLADVRGRIATFLMEQVITTGGKFHPDETVWAQIMYGEDYVWLRTGGWSLPGVMSD
jgi:hypothetical protein